MHSGWADATIELMAYCNARIRGRHNVGACEQDIYLDELDLPFAPSGLGRILDLLSEDCTRRNEPSLVALVVGLGRPARLEMHSSETQTSSATCNMCSGHRHTKSPTAQT